MDSQFDDPTRRLADAVPYPAELMELEELDDADLDRTEDLDVHFGTHHWNEGDGWD